MRTLVSLDTESGIVRRYSENAFLTHEAGLTNDPDDAEKTCSVIERFRAYPHDSFRVVRGGLRTYDDALAEQRARREAGGQVNSLSHRDEA